MTIISPSLLASDFLNLESEILGFKGIPNLWFHLDIMDGHFVPNLTFGHPILNLLPKIAKHPLDAHLMVNNPTFYIETFKDYSIHNLTFHYETTSHLDRMIHSIKEKYTSVGISLNPGTPVEFISDYLLELVDLVLIMSVNPGFGGQKFIPATFKKIETLYNKREQLKAKFQIQVDGGINSQNAKTLIDCGADNLVAGSYIFQVEKKKYKDQVESLRNF